jgi:hypothetical protein
MKTLSFSKLATMFSEFSLVLTYAVEEFGGG